MSQVRALQHPPNLTFGIVKKSYTGAVVQLVRIPACHAGGRGFESRPLRQYARLKGQLIDTIVALFHYQPRIISWREFLVQDIEVHSEFKNYVVTLLVISIFLNLLGASRACARNRGSTD